MCEVGGGKILLGQFRSVAMSVCCLDFTLQSAVLMPVCILCNSSENHLD